MSTATDLSSEILDDGGLYLAAAAKLFPSNRLGSSVSPSCLFRWVTQGVRLEDGRRVYLEATRLAGKWITTKGAIRRFLEAQAPTPHATGSMRTPTQRERSHAAASATLAAKYGMD